MDRCPQLSLIGLQQVSPHPPMIDSPQVIRPSLSLLEGGRQRDLECLGPWLLYCSPVRTIAQCCVIRARHLSPFGGCRESALHEEFMKDSSTPFKILYFFLFWAESKKAQIFLFFFFFHFRWISCISLSDNAARVSPGDVLDGDALRWDVEDLSFHLAIIDHSNTRWSITRQRNGSENLILKLLFFFCLQYSHF